MPLSKVKNIKQAQKESLLRRNIASWMQQESLEDEKLRDFTITKVKLTQDKSTCFVYFYTPKGKDFFEKSLSYLNQYRAALRKALAQSIASRYVVNLVFKYDESFEKQQEIEELIEKLKKDDKL